MKKVECSSDRFVEFFANLYSFNPWIEVASRNAIRQLPKLTVDELRFALKRIASSRRADEYGIVLEMVKAFPFTFHAKIVKLINEMIDVGTTNESWRVSLLNMVPKFGDLTLPAKINSAFAQAFGSKRRWLY